MNSFIPWVGGKGKLLWIINKLMPDRYTRFIDVFGGSGTVTMCRPIQRGCIEVYNDFNSNLTNLFCCVKNRPMALLAELGFLPLNTRDDFNVLYKFFSKGEFTDDYLQEEMDLTEVYLKPPDAEAIRALMLERAPRGSIRRAADFFKLIRYSFSGGAKSFGGKPCDIRRFFHLIWECSRRLANVRFEREGIDIANVSSELITAIYAAFAQKESESISGNMRWSYQRRMESGEFNTCRAPWGFRLDGKRLAVHEDEAEIVRRIFLEYLSGRNPREIAEILNAEDTSGRIWKYKSVDYILQNERYAGNALLQKRYTTATLPKQQKINHGEREMYYVADSNEAIIPQELFDRAKELRQRRSVGQAVTHGRLCVRMRCSCGSRIRAKQVNGRWYWCCCRHDEKGDCAIKPVPEAQTDEAFRRLYYKLKHQSLPILEQMLETLRTICDRRLLWSEDIVSLNKKISELSSQNQTLAFLKQNGLVDPDIFISKSNELTRQLRQAKLDKEELMAAEGDATAQRTQELIALLEDGPDFLDHPDTELCGALIAEIIVESNDTLRFRLHNGLELRESIERTVR